ncbi:MAG: GDP-mannose 4,6-dehydratase [Candidatus Liptonbacteria bacterium]|nr:GDP-mannose 4,6-dehydratase [Candidatus Liptonbacteria bacterium]
MSRNKKLALITGITGQDGSYLAEFLLEKGYEVHGLVRRASTFNRGRIEHLVLDRTKGKVSVNQPIILHYGDITDSSSIRHLVNSLKPDEVYHLGAQSHVGISFETPEFTSDATGLSTIRFLDAIRHDSPGTKFYQASSSEMFGSAPPPQNEKTVFHPRSPYGVAKVFAYYAAVNYREAYNLFATNGILFNHESPRRGENFVSRKITMSLANIMAGKADKLYLGNLYAKRDWGYAKDYVEVMWRMLQEKESDDYVIATGKSRSVKEFVEACCKYLGINLIWEGEGMDERGVNVKTGKTVIAIDAYYHRPADVENLVGDATKARQKLGWHPKTSFEELVKIMLEHDLKAVGVKRENFA